MPESSSTIIRTPHAARYLQQLCKHWAHRFETDFSPTAGRIALPLGEAKLSADDEALTIDLTADDPAKLPDFKDVIARHVERFAFRETLAYHWT